MSERGLVKGIDYVADVDSVLASHRFNVAIVADRPVMESFKDGYGFRMTLFDITDDHVTADKLIESKHNSALRTTPEKHPGYQRQLSCYQLFSKRAGRGLGEMPQRLGAAPAQEDRREGSLRVIPE
jgi:hypothetical protein